ncbi:unnamed protein product [Camellia sinensis]
MGSLRILIPIFLGSYRFGIHGKKSLRFECHVEVHGADPLFCWWLMAVACWFAASTSLLLLICCCCCPVADACWAAVATAAMLL